MTAARTVAAMSSRPIELAHTPVWGKTDASGPEVIRGTCQRCRRPIERKPHEFMWRLSAPEGSR